MVLFRLIDLGTGLKASDDSSETAVLLIWTLTMFV